MKAGPFIAMAALVFVGMWLVFQQHLRFVEGQTPGSSRFRITLGPEKAVVEQAPDPDAPGEFRYRFPEPEVEPQGWLDSAAFQQVIAERTREWESRPAFERGLFGFANISSWGNAVWVLIGLGGQCCFFGRMFIQWVVSERSRQSVVPPLFWWLSFFGGLMLFLYFVWRVDFVGVLGQSSGIVIYARNLRLIRKQQRREARKAAEAQAVASGAPEPGEGSAAGPSGAIEPLEGRSEG